MIAKEKARELYERFFYAIPSMSDESELEHKIAKQCALIAVDEIIKATVLLSSTYYWEEVKLKIEKLC